MMPLELKMECWCKSQKHGRKVKFIKKLKLLTSIRKTNMRKKVNRRNLQLEALNIGQQSWQILKLSICPKYKRRSSKRKRKEKKKFQRISRKLPTIFTRVLLWALKKIPNILRRTVKKKLDWHLQASKENASPEKWNRKGNSHNQTSRRKFLKNLLRK